MSIFRVATWPGPTHTPFARITSFRFPTHHHHTAAAPHHFFPTSHSHRSRGHDARAGTNRPIPDPPRPRRHAGLHRRAAPCRARPRGALYLELLRRRPLAAPRRAGVLPPGPLQRPLLVPRRWRRRAAVLPGERDLHHQVHAGDLRAQVALRAVPPRRQLLLPRRRLRLLQPARALPRSLRPAPARRRHRCRHGQGGRRGL
jgi:hypothetical protein